ncbi:MAG: DUF3098 domain-containing protein [Chitinophagales bacterium]|jgi:hypothetical protein|nr:DUF3098 domain-containing protein [Chitinophagales bacterium]
MSYKSPFQKKNFVLFTLGFFIVVIGLFLMIGENNNIPYSKFPEHDIYSVRRIIVAPIVILFGFGVTFWGIFKK